MSSFIVDFCLGSIAMSLILITDKLRQIRDELQRRTREP